MCEPLAERHLALGQQAAEAGNHGLAEANFRIAAKMMPGHAEASYKLATALAASGKPAESIDEVHRTLTLDPRNVTAYLLLSSLYQRLGKFPEAISASQAALKLSPRLSKPYSDIVKSKKIDASDADLVATLERMVREPERAEGELIGLHYALGKANDDLRQFESAMDHFNAGNAIADQIVGPSLGYRFEDEARVTDQLTRTFSREYFADHSGLGSLSELPVFIVGMIRSGTTLLDTVLSSHPDVASAGELLYWEDEASRLLRNIFRGKVDAAQIADVAERFRRKLRTIGLKRNRVIDKMPINYLHMGLIRTAFPNARFIHIRRHPVDTCLSIYTTEFGLQPPKFAFNRGNIVHAYNEYLKLMDHWRTVIPPDRLMEVDYEELVSNREALLPKVFDFLALPWDESVLRHEDNKNEIATPSLWQARQPIYKTSVARWKNYEPWLGEFRQLLKSDDIA